MACSRSLICSSSAHLVLWDPTSLDWSWYYHLGIDGEMAGSPPVMDMKSGISLPVNTIDLVFICRIRKNRRHKTTKHTINPYRSWSREHPVPADTHPYRTGAPSPRILSVSFSVAPLLSSLLSRRLSFAQRSFCEAIVFSFFFHLRGFGVHARLSTDPFCVVLSHPPLPS